MSDRLLVSMHIPKVAGTSFRKILELHFNDTLLGEYGPKHPSYARFNKYDLSTEIVLLEQGIRCIHGHFKVRKYNKFDAEFITWFRDPSTLLPSMYFYLSKNYPEHPRFPKKGCSLIEFLEYGVNKNILQEHCKEFELDRFLAIGIMEDYDRSLAYMCNKLGLVNPEKKIRVNVNESNALGKGYALSIEERDALLWHNQKDFALYNEALKLHENRTR